MLAVFRFRVPPDQRAALLAAARAALPVLGDRPGFVGARLARSADDPHDWLLVTEWTGMGPWRRALSDYDVRVRVIPWLAGAGVEQGAFEVLMAAEPGGDVTEHPPDAAEPGGDVTERPPDAAEPGGDVTERPPDAAEPGGDVTEHPPDAAEQ